ncbi:LacI family DNA-binding transcriptional regulator [Jiangella gansuensis]|uniref:LacI family DNA-binding transcriptional regulator n=1 Tax=Jiangella gansuensis TaxID=281473 RepID=UPI00146FC238|nr:LacI family DNA-binding transcriptional regulator [Jiangella gansuensis]
MRPPNVADVARAAGVSLGTVSNVLNNPDKVTPATRRRVEAAIASLGFVRNGAARSLAAGTSRTLGFVLTDLTNTFFLDLVRGAEEVTKAADLNILLANSDSRADKQRSYLDLFEEERVAGILLAPRQDLLEQVAPLRARGVRVVVLNADPPDGACSVQTDNVRGGYLATQHLIAGGCRRLMFAGAPRFPAVVDRLEGAKKAVDETAGAVTLEVVTTDGVTATDGHRIAALVDELPDEARPDGLIAGADLLALGVVQSTLVRGRLRIPEDLAVIGYDNNREAWSSLVPITTMDQAGEEMGRVAATMILEELRTPRQHKHRRVVMEPVLVPKASTRRTGREQHPHAASGPVSSAVAPEG